LHKPGFVLHFQIFTGNVDIEHSIPTIVESKIRVMHKVLLISHDEKLLLTLQSILKLGGYEVMLVQEGHAGIQQALAFQPQVVICHLRMPVIDGFGVLHAFRKDNFLSTIPFIIYQEQWDSAAFRKAMNLGADDFLVSPFDNEELLGLVSNRIQKQEQLRKAYSHQHKENMSAEIAIKMLIKNRNSIRLAAYETVYKQGGTPRDLYYIKSGKVKTVKSHPDGKELVIGLYRGKDFFGYMALLEETPYLATAITMEETELIVIPKEDAEQLLDNSPEIARRLLVMMAHNLTEKEERLVSLAYNSLRNKVATALIHLRNKYQGDKSVPFKISIPRDELASIAGTATESLIRTLHDFKEEELIHITKGKIQLVNEKTLEQIAHQAIR